MTSFPGDCTVLFSGAVSFMFVVALYVLHMPIPISLSAVAPLLFRTFCLLFTLHSTRRICLYSLLGTMATSTTAARFAR